MKLTVVWITISKVGMIAVNDGIILRNQISRILKKHFKGKPYYVDLLDLFNEVCFLALLYIWHSVHFTEDNFFFPSNILPWILGWVSDSTWTNDRFDHHTRWQGLIKVLFAFVSTKSELALIVESIFSSIFLELKKRTIKIEPPFEIPILIL